MRKSLLLVTLLAGGASAVLAQDESGYGGAQGADMSIQAIEPQNEAIDTGLAGEVPADIARYLLANGAGGAALSPDGSTVAFSRSITGLDELWVVPAAGGQPRQMTFRTGIDGFYWLPDGSGLLYQADKDGNEQPDYYFISADGLEERVVLPAAEGDFRIFGDFAGDGQSFIYASTLRNQLDFDIYRATINGETELIYEGRYGYLARSLSPDGRFAIVTETVGEDADNLYLLDLETRALRSVSAPPVADRASHSLGGFEWLPDSSGFYFSSNKGGEFGALSRYDVATDQTSVAFDPEHDTESIALCGRGGEYLAWTENEDGFDSLHIWDVQGEAIMAVPELPEGSYMLDCEGDPAQLLVRINGWRTPGELWIVDPAAGTGLQIFAANLAGLDPDRFVRPRPVRYQARDGVTLQGLLYLPPAAARSEDGPPPVLFSVHGGPTAQSRANYDAIAQYHANRGVAVFEPNVRGSTGFGRSYSALDDRERRLDSVRDLVDLLAALGEEGLVDADRAAVMGGSYGGYMVNAVLAAYPEAFDAGVSLFGVADWVTALRVASPALKASDRIEYGDITEDRWVEFYTENSPIRQADRIVVPVLYSHGVMDPRIDISETETMVKTLRANGIDTPFIRMPDEGHGWRKLANRLFYFRRQAEFVEQQLGLSGDE